MDAVHKPRNVTWWWSIAENVYKALRSLPCRLRKRHRMLFVTEKVNSIWWGKRADGTMGICKGEVGYWRCTVCAQRIGEFG